MILRKEPSRSSLTIRRRQFLKLLALAGTVVACQPLSSLSKSDTSSPASSSPVTPGAEGVLTEPSATPAPVHQLIIDGHEDIAWNAIEFGRDPLQSALVIREQEAGQPIEELIGQRTTGLPQWREGRIAVIFSTIFAMPVGHSSTDYQQAVYATPQQAYDVGWKQLTYYHDLASREPSITIVKNRSDLETVVTSWVSPAPGIQPRTGLVMLMEGADPIIEPEDVHGWYENGLRIIAPAWRSTRYAAGTGSYGGSFSQDGKNLLAEMAGLNMILDLSHLSHLAISG